MKTRRFIPILAAVATLACGDDGTGPGVATRADVAGDYTSASDLAAMSFTTTENGTSVDWLEAGAELSLLLATNGSTEGRLFIPATDPDLAHYFEPDDLERGFLEADMAGSWTLENGVVRLEQEADSFMRDLEFTYADGTLSGEETFSGVLVSVVLVRL